MVARVREEVVEMQKVADAEGAGITIEPWDYRYYAEKVRAVSIISTRARSCRICNLRSCVKVCSTPGTGSSGFSSAVWSRSRAGLPSGRGRVGSARCRGWHVGLFYFDPVADRQTIRAWMSDYRSQERFDGPVSPLVSNNCNYMPGRPGEPVLISWEDATTLFHEFGHALHGLLSSVNYPSLSGTNVGDYVEFPSQLLEHWLSTPEVLERFALHHETGRPMPKELATRIERAGRFNEGFRTVEFLASAIVDMKLHLAGDTRIERCNLSVKCSRCWACRARS